MPQKSCQSSPDDTRHALKTIYLYTLDCSVCVACIDATILYTNSVFLFVLFNRVIALHRYLPSIYVLRNYYMLYFIILIIISLAAN